MKLSSNIISDIAENFTYYPEFHNFFIKKPYIVEDF